MGKIYGYCKSLDGFDIKEQLNTIRKIYKDIKVVRYDKNSINNLSKLIDKLSKGDKIVFFSILNISKDYNECFDIYKSLYQRGIEITFLKENYLSTEVFKDIKIEDNKKDDLVISIIKNQIELEFKKHIKNDFSFSWSKIFLIGIIIGGIENLLFNLFGIRQNQLLFL